jgi:hypothetical protein
VNELLRTVQLIPSSTTVGSPTNLTLSLARCPLRDLSRHWRPRSSAQVSTLESQPGASECVRLAFTRRNSRRKKLNESSIFPQRISRTTQQPFAFLYLRIFISISEPVMPLPAENLARSRTVRTWQTLLDGRAPRWAGFQNAWAGFSWAGFSPGQEFRCASAACLLLRLPVRIPGLLR